MSIEVDLLLLDIQFGHNVYTTVFNDHRCIYCFKGMYIHSGECIGYISWIDFFFLFLTFVHSEFSVIPVFKSLTYSCVQTLIILIWFLTSNLILILCLDFRQFLSKKSRIKSLSVNKMRQHSIFPKEKGISPSSLTSQRFKGYPCEPSMPLYKGFKDTVVNRACRSTKVSRIPL